MRKKLLLALFVASDLTIAGYFLAAHLSGGAFPTFGLPLGGDRGELRRMALDFLEDIQFKDFDAAAQYHAPEDIDSVDIPYLLRQLFKVKPEALDIMDYDVVFAEKDNSGNRARVKVRVKTKILLNSSIEEKEMILYFHRADENAPWFMKFEDSLRNPEKTEGKKG